MSAASATTAIVSRDFLGPSIAYFNNHRVPAAVLAGIAMKDVFVLQATPPSCMSDWDDSHGVARSRSWRTLRYAYLLLMVLAFSLEINTIFVATQVSTQLATATGFDSKSPASLVSFLVRDFEYEYSTVRCHFLTGLLSFTVAQALRVRWALRKYTLLSVSGMCCLLTAASGMLTYTNARTVTYGGFGALLRRNLILSMRFLVSNMRRGPMSVITMTCFVLTVFFALCGWFGPEFVVGGYGEELDDEVVHE
mmetsp:Transcript_38570/g.115769  ORF Transcript_38570/g.115769 Transcript_38570/m.115769 type:complete len:251 (-) Transcript_38570:519-1271(-)|eukprot:CAMPEP_0113559450 /NCGR_PEP_ID=MMETSP0015_2-20120614/18904_1 /TAXON_ID=2838 /ORGANISM="Odontella" /LENGTH=250 /DNA_ID=CAMNT_0000461089 /DNA_START=149 /DNA_END=901 /DNA_ORIENTATION=+ /assembly_acc=CAM_ASM_000160